KNRAVELLNFIQVIENQKRKYKSLQAVGLTQFAEIAEQSQSTERKIGNLYRDQSMLLQYTEAILKQRNLRWDEEVTGLIGKATDAIVYSIIASIKDVVTRDIKNRIKVVMLSGRAFYFENLQTKLASALKTLLV